jgi:hypothetical protein
MKISERLQLPATLRCDPSGATRSVRSKISLSSLSFSGSDERLVRQRPSSSSNLFSASSSPKTSRVFPSKVTLLMLMRLLIQCKSNSVGFLQADVNTMSCRIAFAPRSTWFFLTYLFTSVNSLTLVVQTLRWPSSTRWNTRNRLRFNRLLIHPKQNRTDKTVYFKKLPEVHLIVFQMAVDEYLMITSGTSIRQ